MENHRMSCQICDDLIAAYKRSVTDFTKFVRGGLKEGARMATNEAQELSQQCKNGSDALMAHWSHDHG